MARASLSTPGVLESNRVGLAMHFLQKKIELLAEFARAVQQFSQTVAGGYADDSVLSLMSLRSARIAASCARRAGSIVGACRANLQTTFQAAGKRWTQSRGVCVDLLGKFVESREAPAQIVYKVAPPSARQAIG